MLTGVMPRILIPLARTEHAPLNSRNLACGHEENEAVFKLQNCCIKFVFFKKKKKPAKICEATVLIP